MNTSTISKTVYDQLISFTGETCVSLYIPTDSTNPDPRTNGVTFKNAINKALSQLEALGLKNETYEALDRECERLMTDEVFWKEQAKSFALLACGNQVFTFKLRESHPELLMINDHFYVLPLISQYAEKSAYYILDLDKEFTQMWFGTEHSLSKIEVPDLPRSVEEVTGEETNERNLQFHTGTDAGGSGNRPAMYHGSSSWKDDKDRYLERFLQAVDKAVIAFLKEKQTPLLLSGVEESTVMYRKLSKVKTLVDATLPKSPDPTKKEEQLHEQSWKVIAELQKQQRADVVSAFEETVPAKKLTLFPEILRQAAQGRVDSILLAENTRTWGMFDPESLTYLAENEQKPQSAELLNLAARLVLQNSGRVVILPQDEMPAGETAVATLRY